VGWINLTSSGYLLHVHRVGWERSHSCIDPIDIDAYLGDTVYALYILRLMDIKKDKNTIFTIR
jgi:hypothetical protein